MKAVACFLGFSVVVFALFFARISHASVVVPIEKDVLQESSSVLTCEEEVLASSGRSGHEHDKHDDAHCGNKNLGVVLPLWSCLPFLCMLLSIAFFPLLAPEFWHHNFGKVSAFWAVCMAVPALAVYKEVILHEIAHIILADYLPFIILLWSLYTVSGGILVRGSLRGSPLVNIAMLSIGAVLASFMGTTGAAMLMIRPLLRANRYRKSRTFIVVFFIFLVANVGGSLTPLGDPPLFLGFLHGVSFFWTMNNIALHAFTTMALLLGVYAIMDFYFYRKEKPKFPDRSKNETLFTLDGVHNFIFLAGIVAAVLMSGIVDWGSVNTVGIHRTIQDWARDAILILMGIMSLLTTDKKLRENNGFTWFPIVEVAYLFVGIFITMVPCLLILKAGAEGQMGFLINSVEKPVHYFWVTGILSGFLDNAPTYLTFFSTALGSCYPGVGEAQAVPLLMSENCAFLQAISTGAVFFGACTYIGNAPNFMVRSIAEEAGTPMPSFFGYIFKYSLVFLFPIFVLISIIYF